MTEIISEIEEFKFFLNNLSEKNFLSFNIMFNTCQNFNSPYKYKSLSNIECYLLLFNERNKR